MVRLFEVGEETRHHAGDPQCAECWEEYPATCTCGGLIHATGESDEDRDDGNVSVTTKCDRCGRSEEQIEPR